MMGRTAVMVLLQIVPDGHDDSVDVDDDGDSGDGDDGDAGAGA